MKKIDSKKKLLRLSFDDFKMSGYSASPVGANHLLGQGFYHGADVIRNINKKSSNIGLFKENEDIYFWWFDKSGSILHENKCHLNNIGLVSQYDNSLKKNSNQEYRIAVAGCEMTGATTSNCVWPDSLSDFLNRNKPFKKKIQVFNFGHLDTGIHEWKKIWLQRIKKINADLLIVNIPIHTFYRKGNIFNDASHWDQLPGFRYVNYFLENGENITSWIISKRKNETLKDPKSYTEKLLSFWLDPKLARNSKKIKTFREIIIDEYIQGSKFKNSSSLDPKKDNYPIIPKYKLSEMVRWVQEHVIWFNDNVKNVFFTLNPWMPHFVNYNDYLSKDVLLNFCSNINVIDMRKSWKLWGVHDDIQTLYSKYANEKWSDEGHLLYGEAIGIEVMNYLGIKLD